MAEAAVLINADAFSSSLPKCSKAARPQFSARSAATFSDSASWSGAARAVADERLRALGSTARAYAIDAPVESSTRRLIPGG